LGPRGPQGPAGAPGQIRLVSCQTITKTVKVHGHKRKRKLRKCTTRLIAASATFTTTAARATLTRGRVVYAVGSARLDRLMLRTRRAIPPGRYTLTLRHRDGRRWITTRRTITIA
ncbi:MAG: hypothetical protein ACRDL5_06050, partial [Solirubrobacteraceae bacterium]